MNPLGTTHEILCFPIHSCPKALPLDITKTDLNTSDVYNILKDVVLGEQTMHRGSEEPCDGLGPGVMTVLLISPPGRKPFG